MKALVPLETKVERNTEGLLPTKAAAYDASVSLSEPKMTTDSFSNPMARLGEGTQNLMQATQYPLTRRSNNYILLNSLFRTNWVVGNIVSTIPQDVTKKWFKVSTKKRQADIKKLNDLQKTLKIRQKIVSGMNWGRLYGGAAGIILIKGQNDLSKPLDLDTIMPDSFRGLFIVDRWSGIFPSLELVNDIMDPDYGLPEFYRIRDGYGIEAYKVHHSRVIRFIGTELPYFEQIAEQYWGKSIIESIYEEIVKKDNVSHNIASLTFKANLDVIEMEGIDQLFALGGEQMQKRFWNTIQAQSVLQSNFGTRVISKGDTFNQFQYGFAGLRDVYEVLLLDVAGASRIPATKLFGRSPTGMNATGESDLVNYDNYIEEVRESDFKPIVDKLLPIMALSCWGEIPDDLETSYDAIRSPNELDKATIAQRKVGAILDAYNSNGITADVMLKELKALAPVTGMFESITDEQILEGEGKYKSDIEAMQDPLASLGIYPQEALPEDLDNVE